MHEDAVKFHGHLCPMFALGLRMGKMALRELGRSREDGVKLIAVVEFKNCLADGIQFVCGTTYGKNNLYYKPHGKFAVSFYDLANEKSLRIRIKNEILKNTLEYGIKSREVKKLPAKERAFEADKLFKYGKEIIQKLEKMKDGELFEISGVLPFMPEEEPMLDYIICESCGEVVLKEFAEGKMCKGCSEEPFFRPLHSSQKAPSSRS